jgi:hypothetical protein
MHQDLNDAFMQMQTIAVCDMRSRDARQAVMEAIGTKEEINKEEMSGWPAERLDLVGARRVEKDQFWYEVNCDNIADKTAA